MLCYCEVENILLFIIWTTCGWIHSPFTFFIIFLCMHLPAAVSLCGSAVWLWSWGWVYLCMAVLQLQWQSVLWSWLDMCTKRNTLCLFLWNKNRNYFCCFWEVNEDSDLKAPFGVGVGHKFVTAWLLYLSEGSKPLLKSMMIQSI